MPSIKRCQVGYIIEQVCTYGLEKRLTTSQIQR